jgi:hypothetical protein
VAKPNCQTTLARGFVGDLVGRRRLARHGHKHVPRDHVALVFGDGQIRNSERSERVAQGTCWQIDEASGAGRQTGKGEGFDKRSGIRTLVKDRTHFVHLTPPRRQSVGSTESKGRARAVEYLHELFTVRICSFTCRLWSASNNKNSRTVLLVNEDKGRRGQA